MFTLFTHMRCIDTRWRTVTNVFEQNFIDKQCEKCRSIENWEISNNLAP